MYDAKEYIKKTGRLKDRVMFSLLPEIRVAESIQDFHAEKKNMCATSLGAAAICVFYGMTGMAGKSLVVFHSVGYSRRVNNNKVLIELEDCSGSLKAYAQSLRCHMKSVEEQGISEEDKLARAVLFYDPKQDTGGVIEVRKTIDMSSPEKSEIENLADLIPSYSF